MRPCAATFSGSAGECCREQQPRPEWLVAPSILLEAGLLVPPIRGLEPVEATNGMLLAASLNTAIVFAILSNMVRHHAHYEDFSARSSR
jgi:hypothetical protein